MGNDDLAGLNGESQHQPLLGEVVSGGRLDEAGVQSGETLQVAAGNLDNSGLLAGAGIKPCVFPGRSTCSDEAAFLHGGYRTE
ncbi:hypothetical protein [Streptomyces nodosus]|uniref:hypothetical protein n=1 Tax=Streptomyces nodosus TaxID=40318 RepID=UPI001186B47F|nr:hypothetical protein [Streptomyces nodosus]